MLLLYPQLILHPRLHYDIPRRGDPVSTYDKALPSVSLEFVSRSPEAHARTGDHGRHLLKPVDGCCKNVSSRVPLNLFQDEGAEKVFHHASVRNEFPF